MPIYEWPTTFTLSATTTPAWWTTFNTRMTNLTTALSEISIPATRVTDNLRSNENMEQLTSTTQMTEMAVGETVTIRHSSGNADRNSVYTKRDDNRWENDGGASLPVTSFAASIRDGSVWRSSRYEVGDCIGGNDGMYYKILGREDGQYVCAKTDGNGRARSTERVVMEPEGRKYREADFGNDVAAAFKFISDLEQSRVLQARLDAIMSSGEVPDEKEYAVTVEITGSVDVRPTMAQAKDLIGDTDLRVTRPAAFPVAYTKTVEVVKSSRWGCACDTVVREDLAAPGAVASWTVESCKPQDGTDSVVHVAPEPEPEQIVTDQEVVEDFDVA